MTDKLEAAVRNGRHAVMLLDDAVLKEALEKLEQFAVEALLTCVATEIVERRADVTAIRKLRQALRAYVDAGAIAQRSLNTN